MYVYFINIILEGSVETNLQCGKVCNNHVIANCSVKEF